MCKCFVRVLTAAVAAFGREPRLPPLFGFERLSRQLFVDQFREMIIRVAVVIGGELEPFPLDTLDSRRGPIVFRMEISV
jgi:hypothetical protein